MAEGADAEISCPICLVSSNDDAASEDIAFVKTPCGHEFCTSCIERVLLKPRQDRNGIGIPTRGQCPMCREPVSLFDMTRAGDNSQCTTATVAGESPLAYEKVTDASSWPIADSQYNQRSLIPRQNADVMFQRLLDLKGVIEGFGITFCFRKPSPSMEFAKPLKMAFDCDWTEIKDSDDNNLMTMDSITFDRSHFHQKSMTFHGEVSFANSVCNTDSYFYEKLECLLHFSDDGQYIRKGNLRWKFASTTIQSYPLDGIWEVHYSREDSTVINVQKHYFTCYGVNYNIIIDEYTNCPHFTWDNGDNDTVKQTSTQRILPGSIDVGATLNWTTNEDGYEQIVWQRLATDLSNSLKSVEITPGSLVYRKCNQHPDNEQLGPTYQGNNLWGNTFCQAFLVGLASYHFLVAESDNDHQAYISYESPRTGDWPALDNGETVPSRVPFRNIQWNPETRTFKGDICWEEDYGTSWMSESKWSYVIKFDPAFMFVESGTCTRSMGLPHQFGDDLVYVNAACETPLREIFQTTQSPVEFLDAVRQFRDDGASQSTLQMLGEVAMNIMGGDRESMFDFNL